MNYETGLEISQGFAYIETSFYIILIASMTVGLACLILGFILLLKGKPNDSSHIETKTDSSSGTVSDGSEREKN